MPIRIVGRTSKPQAWSGEIKEQGKFDLVKVIKEKWQENIM